VRPVFVNGFAHLSGLLLAGDNVTLSCIFKTSPASIITWWKDGTYISQSQLPWVLEGLSDSELRIVNAMQKDSGSYQCISKTNFSSREPELTVSSPFINVTVEVPVQVHVIPPGAHLENSSVLFVCEYKGSPSPELTWSFKGRRLTNGVNGIVINKGAFFTLEIHNVSFNNVGEYECNGTNILSGGFGVRTSTSSTYLVVEAIAKITRQPSDVTAQFSQATEFVCGASGSPPPMFKWLHNNVQVTASSKFSIQTSRLESNLTIHNLQASDQGTVICVIENNITAVGAMRKEMKSNPANLVVKAILPIAKLAQTVIAEVGTTGAISCLYSGSPVPVVGWYRNGTKLLEDERINIFTVLGNVTVTITNLMKNDSGNYTCVVSNEEGIDFGGSATATTALIVYNPLEFWTCQPYTGTVCSRYINGNNTIFYDLFRVKSQESEMLMRNFTQALNDLRPSQNCLDFAYQLMCHYTFPPCRIGVQPPSRRPICREDCQIMSSELCPTVWQKILPYIQKLNPGYTGTFSCSNFPSMNGGDETECVGVSDVSPPGDRENTLVTRACIRGKGRGYKGKVNVTRSGYTCQSWDIQSPHPHSILPEDYPLELSGAANFCRNPGGRAANGPWCYTSNATVRWDYCNISMCGKCTLS
jgi:hypothetical protein